MFKREVSDDEAVGMGVFTKHEQMDNGDFRFRLMGEDGSCYIRTVGGPVGAWQNSRYHMHIKEMCIVQKEWIAFAEFAKGCDNIAIIRIFPAGTVVVSRPNQPHNVYMAAGAITHTVKFGDVAAEKASGKPDWHRCPELDKLTQKLTESEIHGQVSSK